jgi:hypothetical protein
MRHALVVSPLQFLQARSRGQQNNATTSPIDPPLKFLVNGKRHGLAVLRGLSAIREGAFHPLAGAQRV